MSSPASSMRKAGKPAGKTTKTHAMQDILLEKLFEEERWKAALSKGCDKDIRKEAAKTAPKDSNEMNGNLFVSIPHITSGGSCNFHDNLEADPSLFKDPEHNDWELTPEGLEFVGRECPGFEPLPFSSMGREG